MNCPLCGYIMDAFDVRCQKCQGKGLVTKSQVSAPPNISTAPTIMASVQVTSPLPQSQLPIQQLRLLCPVCSSENTQKVSVLYNSGTQHSNYSGSSIGHSSHLGHGFSGGNFGMMGLNVADYDARQTTYTELAKRLRPPRKFRLPAKPQPPTPPPKIITGGIAAILSLIVSLLAAPFAGLSYIIYVGGYRPSWGDAAFLMCLPLFVLATCFVVFIVGCFQNAIHRKTANKQYAADLALWHQQSPQAIANWEHQCATIKASWERKKANWERLYYCLRCDHVYNSETSEAALSAEIDSIL